MLASGLAVGDTFFLDGQTVEVLSTPEAQANGRVKFSARCKNKIETHYIQGTWELESK